MHNKKWYKTNVAVITFLVLFFPFGLYLMWRYSDWSNQNKRVITILFSIYIVLVMLLGAFAPPPADNPADKKQETKTQPSKKEQPVIQEKPKASFESSIVATGTPNPATFVATVLMKNTSQVAGKATCFVTASDVSGTYKGFDSFPLDKELAPAEEYIFNATLVITKQGSIFVDNWRVECNPT